MTNQETFRACVKRALDKEFYIIRADELQVLTASQLDIIDAIRTECFPDQEKGTITFSEIPLEH